MRTSMYIEGNTIYVTPEELEWFRSQPEFVAHKQSATESLSSLRKQNYLRPIQGKGLVVRREIL